MLLVRGCSPSLSRSVALGPAAVCRRAFFLLGTLMGAPAVALAPTVTLTASPTSGSAPLTTTLTWASSNADSCTASNGWTGTKSLSGTETITGLSASRTFTLTCLQSTGSERVTWTAPAQNTDGTALTNLAGFQLFHSTTSAGVSTATPIEVPGATVTTFTITGLPTGLRYFGAKAVNSLGVASDMSALVSATVALQSASASVSVTVATKPMPPTLVSVSQVVYELVPDRWNVIRLGRVVGSVPLGVPCQPEPVVSGSYYPVPFDAVSLTKAPKSDVLVAPCAAG